MLLCFIVCLLKTQTWNNIVAIVYHCLSGQSNLVKAALILWGNLGLTPNTMFLRSPRVSTPSRTSIRSAVFAEQSRVTDRLTDPQYR